MRRTHSLVLVAVAMLERPRARHWGYDLGKQSGVRSGVLYPMLTRMLAEGWVTDGWEEVAPSEKRPARRYYVITEDGLRELGSVVRAAQTERRFRGLAFGGVAT